MDELNKSASGSPLGSQSIQNWRMPTAYGVILGACAGGPLGALIVYSYSEESILLLQSTLKTIAILLLLMCPGVWILHNLLMEKFNTAKGSIVEVVQSIHQTALNAMKGDAVAAVDASHNAAIIIAQWQSRIQLRNWSIAAAISLLTAFAGLIAALFTLHQIRLMRDQNALIQRQTELIVEQSKIMSGQSDRIDSQILSAEAQRREPFMAEALEISRQIASKSNSNFDDSDLPLIARVVNLTNLAVPTIFPQVILDLPFVRLEYINPPPIVPQVSYAPISPERGIILRSIINKNLDVSVFIAAGAVFRFADMRHATIQDRIIQNADLLGIDLTASFLNNVKFINTNLRGARLTSSCIRGTQFEVSDLNYALMDKADIRDVRLTAPEGRARLDASAQDAIFYNIILEGYSQYSVSFGVAVARTTSLPSEPTLQVYCWPHLQVNFDNQPTPIRMLPQSE
jgi:hypothetical protein